MSTSPNEKGIAAHIIALVELDMQKKRVRFFLAREAIRQRMQELDLTASVADETNATTTDHAHHFLRQRTASPP
jgi:hypothetical protein